MRAMTSMLRSMPMGLIEIHGQFLGRLCPSGHPILPAVGALRHPTFGRSWLYQGMSGPQRSGVRSSFETSIGPKDTLPFKAFIVPRRSSVVVGDPIHFGYLLVRSGG
jgi:hypothetical protein